MSTVAGCLAIAATLSGCVFSYDAAKPVVTYQNNSDQAVTVVIEGTSSRIQNSVSSHGASADAMSECVGTAIRVQSEDGELLGRVDKQACPGWQLTINEDGTLDYAEK